MERVRGARVRWNKGEVAMGVRYYLKNLSKYFKKLDLIQ